MFARDDNQGFEREGSLKSLAGEGEFWANETTNLKRKTVVGKRESNLNFFLTIVRYYF